jgi:hypothetical protein
MTGSGCGAKVERFVPKGYHGVIHAYKCGQMGVDGFPVLCDPCEKKFEEAGGRHQFRVEMAECGENIDDDY